MTSYSELISFKIKPARVVLGIFVMYFCRYIPILCLGLLSPFTALAKLAVLRVGYIDFHPFVTATKNDPEGDLIDYSKEVFSEAQIKPQWVPVSISRAQDELKNGRLDLILTFFKTPEREQYADYSDVPLLQNSGGVCLRQDRLKNLPSGTLRIAHVQSTVLPTNLASHHLESVTASQAQLRMLRMLEKNRVDLIFSPRPEIFLLTSTSIKLDLKCYVFQDINQPIYFAYSKSLDRHKQAQLNLALAKRVKRESFIDFFLGHSKYRHPQGFKLYPIESKVFAVPFQPGALP